MHIAEREAIILDAAWEMIDGMVNWAMFVKNDRTESTSMTFESDAHARIFLILLGDFLSEIRAFKGKPIPLGLLPAPSGARSSDLTFLFHLRRICVNPQLGSDTAALGIAVESFADWLETEFTTEGVNLAAIDVVVDLRVLRLRYLRMCADITKHNLARLETNVRHLRDLLETAGRTIDEQQAYLAIEDFYDWFYRGIFLCHASSIAQFLNNIRWAMYDYLQPEYRRSWHLTPEATAELPLYSYRIPAEITEPLARAMYWNVMNRVRSGPFVQRFTVDEVFKKRY